MTDRRGGVAILTVQGLEDVPATVGRISRIRGVKSVDYNNLHQKLLVRYEGDASRLRETDLEIAKVLDGRPRLQE